MLRLFAWLSAALAALALLAICAIAFAWISVDAQRWREPIAAALARALGREVRIEGPARLALSFHPDLVVHDVRIGNPPGFAARDFATIRELRLDTDLLPLLRNELIIRELRGRGVTVRLARSREGRGNWIFEPAARDPGEERRRRFSVDWRRVVAEQATVEYEGAVATRKLSLDKVVLEGLTGLPVRVEVNGRVNRQLTYRAEATSAPLAELGGEQPWPFMVRFVSPRSVANISGTRQSAGDGLAVRVKVGAGTADLKEIEALLGAKLPVSGAAAMAGELEFTPGSTTLKALNGVFGGIAVSGELALDTSGPRPLVSGRLTVPEVDFRDIRAGGRRNETKARTLAAVYNDLQTAELDLAGLAQLDADVNVAVGSLAESPGDVHDVDASLRLEAGRLIAPFAATISGARFEGELSADGTMVPPRFGLRLTARDALLGGLADLVFDVPYVAGKVRRFDASFNAAGNTLAELVHDLDGRIGIEDARFTYGNYASARPVTARIAAAEVTQPRGRTIATKVRGSLRGKEFAGTFRAGSVERILRERRTPFTFDGTSGDVRARLSGTLAEPSESTGPEVVFDVSAPRARELTPWLGFPSQSDARVALKGTAQVRKRRATLVGGSLAFGRTLVKGDVEWERLEGKALVKANLLAEVLAPAELNELRSASGQGARNTLVYIPILPEALDFADSDVALHVKRVDGAPLDIADIAFKGRMRDGVVKSSPFSLRLQDNLLAGTLALDARSASPTASLRLAGKDFDAGALLRRLRVARDIDSRIGKVELKADIRERRLGDVLEHSSFAASIESGTLAFRDANTRAALRIAAATGELRAEAGGPVKGSISGTAGTVPITLELEGGRLRELVEPSARWPFSIAATLPEAKLAIHGSAAPLREPAVAISLALNGRRLSDLDTFLETALPPWGPYSLNGQLRFTQSGYEMKSARLAIGDSVLQGSGSLDTRSDPPRLEAALTAKRVQLDDFPLGDWSPLPASGSTGPLTVETARRAIAGGAQTVHAMLSRERLRLGDADVEVRVEELASGKEKLGRARLGAGVNSGVARIGPVEFEVQAGRARGSFTYEPRERDVVFGARAIVDRLDYGLIMRRFSPDSSLTGAFSLDLALDATAPDLSGVLRTASGHADLAVWPEELDWGAFDLWTVNMLRSLLPMFDPTPSRLNCIVGHFDLSGGELRSQRLLIDTTNTRVAGQAEASFASERLHLRFVPGHKSPRLFSFAVPVEVRGTFDDYRIALRPADAFGTVGQWLASLVRVPLSWFGVGRLPADGQDVCTDPLRQRPADKAPENGEPANAPQNA